MNAWTTIGAGAAAAAVAGATRWYRPDWLSPLADWLSVLSLALTFVIALQTTAIRRRFLRRGRLPELRRQLAASSRKLLDHLSQLPIDFNQTAATLAVIRSQVSNLQEKLSSKDAARTKALRKALTGRRKHWFSLEKLGTYSETELWQVYHELVGVLDALQQLEKDAVWD